MRWHKKTEMFLPFKDLQESHSPLGWAASKHLERARPFPAKGRPSLLLPALGLGCSDRSRADCSRVALAAMDTGSHHRWCPGWPSTVPTPCTPLGAALRPHTLGSRGTGVIGLYFKNKQPPRSWLFSESKQRKHAQAQASLCRERTQSILLSRESR